MVTTTVRDLVVIGACGQISFCPGYNMELNYEKCHIKVRCLSECWLVGKKCLKKSDWIRCWNGTPVSASNQSSVPPLMCHKDFFQGSWGKVYDNINGIILREVR